MNVRDLALKPLILLHKTVFRASEGRLLSRGSGMPVLMLTTTGRKSGQKRTTMLTTPLEEGNRIMLVASNGGDHKDPDWLLNLRADPHVDVTRDGATRPMTARVAGPDEKATLWPRIVADHDHYGGYQDKTDRDIPVVVLEP